MVEKLRVIAVIAMRDKIMDGQRKEIDIKKGIERGDAPAAPTRFHLLPRTVNASTEVGRNSLPNPEAPGTVIRDSRKMMSTGKSP